MYKCKHCGQEFETKYQLSGHSTRCEKNPRYQHNCKVCNENLSRYNSKHTNRYQTLSLIDEITLRKVVNESQSYSEVLTKLGYTERGGEIYRILKDRLSKFNIDTSFFKGKAHGKTHNRKYDLSEVFIQHSLYRGKLIYLMVNNNIKPYKCECCGISEWMNKHITLQVHHINGDHFDNRLENLQILCPNCHSQTNNFGGANVK